MTWKSGAGIAFVAVLATSVNGQEAGVRYDNDRDRTYVADHDGNGNWCAYKANELNFGFFGTGTVGKSTVRRPSLNRIERDGELGAGIDIQYFFHRYVGIGVDAYAESTHNNWVDNIDVDLIARLPLGTSGVAPYIMAGGGRQLDPIYQWTLNAGAGIEWRFAQHVGIFIDGRYVWADETRDYGLGRAGLRVGF